MPDPIVLKVDSQFDQRAAAEAAREAERYWERKAAHLKVSAKLDEASARKAEGDAKERFLRSAAEYRVEAKLDERSARLAAAEAKRIFSDVGKSLSSTITPAADGAASSLTQVGKAGASIASAGGPIAIAVIGAGLIDLAGIAASAAQAMWLLPAAASAAGAGIGTLVLGMHGFSDALKDVGDPKKFAEDLRSLAPSAREAAQSIQGLMPALTGLQQATQQSLFANVGPQLQSLATQFVPMVQQATTGIAGAFNSAFQGISAQLQTSGTSGAIQQLLNNIADSFRALAPAAAPFVKALADIAAVGSGFLPELARELTVAAQKFSEFITHAKESGDLKKWIGEGIDTLKLLGGMVIDAAKAFAQLAPLGQQVLPPIAAAFKIIMVAIAPVATAVAGLGPAFTVLPGIVNSVAAAVIPKINMITGALNNLTAPIRWAASLIGVSIPEIPAIAQPDQSVTGTGASSENRTSRRPADILLPGSPASGGGIGSGASNVATAPATGPSWSAPGGPLFNPSAPLPSGSGSSSSPGGGGSAAPAASVAPAAGYSATGGGLIAYAQAQAGKPYGPSAGPTYFDCSGIWSDLYALVTGKPYTGSERYFTTESDFTKLGFVRGFEPGGFNIGVKHGGPGGGHMAGTLPNGTNVEAGGGGNLKVGGNAQGALSPQFTEQWHLPGVGGGGTPLAAQPFASGGPGGNAVPVFVVNWDGQMRGGPLAPGGPSALAPPGAPGGPGGTGPGGTAGPTDLLGSFFKGLSKGGGWGGVAGGIGTNIMDIVSQGAPGFAGGGGVDNIPAMLTRGEHVLTRNDVNALGGQSGVYALRNALHSQGAIATNPRDNRWGWGPKDPYGRNPTHSDIPGHGITGGPSWWPSGPKGRDDIHFPSEPWSPLDPHRMNRRGVNMFATGGAVGFQTGGLVDPKNAPPPPKPPPIVVNTGQGTGPPPGPPVAVQGRAQGEGGWQPGKPAGGGGGGGLIGQAASMLPGGQIVSQLAMRAAEFGGQALAIGASGLMETFLPSGSQLGDPSKSWFGKLASGFGGARASTGNTAGKPEPVAPRQVDPNTTQHGTGGGQPPGPGGDTWNIHGSDPQAIRREIAREQESQRTQNNAHGAGMGW